MGEGQPSAAWADRCVAPSSGALCRSSTGGMPAWQGPGLRCGLGGPRWEAAGVGGPYPYVVCVLLGLIRAHWVFMKLTVFFSRMHSRGAGVKGQFSQHFIIMIVLKHSKFEKISHWTPRCPPPRFCYHKGKDIPK